MADAARTETRSSLPDKGSEISAEEAKTLGFVAEIVPHDQVLPRAREIARELLTKNQQILRFPRVAMVQHIKRRMLDDLGYGLMR